MTRAADRLYICGTAMDRKVPDDCWYNLVRRGLEAIAEAVEIEVPARGSSGWRGEGLRLATPQTKDQRSEGESRITARHLLPGWARRPPAAEPTPSRPSDADPPTLSPLARGGEAFRRGLLVHRLLEILPAVAPEARLEAARRFLARPIHEVPPAEQDEIAAEVLAVLQSPDFGELFGPLSRAEVPVVGTVGGIVVSGRIDRLVVADGRVGIVDFKTNRPIPAGPDLVPGPYIRQLALYRALVAKIYPKLTITCGIIWTAAPRLMWITEPLLAGVNLDGTPPQP
jgi:ATP-dependent helicase/nuclease subunit A